MTFIDIEILDFDANGIERIADFGEELGLGVAGDVIRNGEGTEESPGPGNHARACAHSGAAVLPYEGTQNGDC
jgi:hypothetical protein